MTKVVPFKRRRRAQRPRQPRKQGWWQRAKDYGGFLILTAVLVAAASYFPIGGASGNVIAVDGDSLRPSEGGADIRLHGIDAPELGQRCENAQGRQYNCGTAARNHLRKLIGGRDVTCKTMDVDRYGRTVAVCRAGDTELNRQMVLDGWALAYRQHEHRYIGNEATARNNRRGVWQGRFERPGDWRAMYRSDASAD